jgi:hypothetical protein
MWYNTIELTEIEYIVLMIMCIFIIISFIIKLFRNNNNKEISETMKSLVEFFYNHLDSLDSYIKYYSVNTRAKHMYIIQQMAKIMDKKLNYFILYLLANVLPRLIVISVFIWEIFYYNHISLFYKLIPLLIIPMIVNYMYYSFNKLCDSVEDLDNYIYLYDVDDENDNTTPILARDGLHRVSLRRLKGEQIDFKLKVAYKIVLKFKPLEKDSEIYSAKIELLTSTLNDFIYVYQIVYLYNQKKIKYDKRVDITISLIYSICILYIMLTCTVEFSIENFELFKLLINKEEPFSGLYIS